MEEIKKEIDRIERGMRELGFYMSSYSTENDRETTTRIEFVFMKKTAELLRDRRKEYAALDAP